MVFPFQTDMAKPPPLKPRKRKNPAPLPLMMMLGLLQRRHNRPTGPTLKKAVLMQRMMVLMQQMTFVSLGPVHRLDPRQWSGSPLNTSDNEKFKKFVAFLDPKVTIPGRNAITNLLDNRQCRSSFLGATVNFFNQIKRKRENYRLCLRKFNSRHTAPNIMAMTQ